MVSVFFDFTDVLADFGNAESGSIEVRVRGVNLPSGFSSGFSSGFGNPPMRLFAQIFESDETTPLTDEHECASVGVAGDWFDVTTDFTGVDPIEDKAVWDAARVRFRWGGATDEPINDSGFTIGFTKGFEA